MKKNVRNLLIMLAVLLVLGGAAWALTSLPQEEAEEVSSAAEESSQPAQALLEGDASQVESIEVSNQAGGFTMVRIDGEGADEFTIKGYEGYGLNHSLISTGASGLMGFSAAKSLGSREDLEAFGLSGDGQASVLVNYSGGGNDTLLIGNPAAETSGRYVLKDGEIYIVPGVPETFLSNQYGFFSTGVYTIADRTTETVAEDGSASTAQAPDIMETITFSGAHFPEDITIEYAPEIMNEYRVTKPVAAESGNTAFTDIMDSLKSLTASSVVSADVSDKSLEEHGLLEPDAKVSFTLNGSSHELAVSAKDADGNRYLTADGNGVIYQVSNELVSKWAQTDLTSLRMSYICIPNINDVQSVTVTVDGDQVYRYDVERTETEKSTEDKKDYELTVTKPDGSAVDYEEAYQPFYMKLISLAVFSGERLDYSGGPRVKVEYKYFEGGGDTVEFYWVQDKDRYVATLNGGFNGQIRSTEMDAMLDTLP